MLTVMLKLLRMIFIFLKFLKLSFLFFSVMREITEVCYHFITVVSLTNMSHFLIIIIGNKKFLDIAEHFIYFFDQNAWFSLYESQSPSYFICYNTISPLSLGTVLQIEFDQLNSFLWFFHFNFRLEARDLRTILQQFLDHLDMRTSLTIHLYLNRPPYDLQLDLGTVERNIKRLLYHFLPIPLYNLFQFFPFKFILMHVIHII